MKDIVIAMVLLTSCASKNNGNANQMKEVKRTIPIPESKTYYSGEEAKTVLPLSSEEARKLSISNTCGQPDCAESSGEPNENACRQLGGEVLPAYVELKDGEEKLAFYDKCPKIDWCGWDDQLCSVSFKKKPDIPIPESKTYYSGEEAKTVLPLSSEDARKLSISNTCGQPDCAESSGEPNENACRQLGGEVLPAYVELKDGEEKLAFYDKCPKIDWCGWDDQLCSIPFSIPISE